MFERSKASISFQGNLYGGAFKVVFHNVGEGKEAGSQKRPYKSSEKYFQQNGEVK